MSRQFALFGRRLGEDGHGSLLYLADDIGTLQSLIDKDDGKLFWIKHRFHPFDVAMICDFSKMAFVSSYRVGPKGHGEWSEMLEDAGVRIADPDHVSIQMPTLPIPGRLADGVRLLHREWGPVVAKYSPQYGWHYLRFGYAGYDTDFENIIAEGWGNSE